MNEHNPIIVVDDDNDDLQLFKDACKELKIPNELIMFGSGQALLEHFDKLGDPPFLIVCDFNLPGMNGLKLRKTIMADPYLRYKSVPYLIWTTGPTEPQVRDAYEHMVQGFFMKPPSFEELRTMVSSIVDYWKISIHPTKN